MYMRKGYPCNDNEWFKWCTKSYQLSILNVLSDKEPRGDRVLVVERKALVVASVRDDLGAARVSGKGIDLVAAPFVAVLLAGHPRVPVRHAFSWDEEAR